MTPTPTPLATLQAIRLTLTTLGLQLDSLQAGLLAPASTPLPPSPPTILVPGDTSPIIDLSGQSWTILPGAHATPTLHLNGHPDPLTSPVASAVWDGSQLWLQKATGQWRVWTGAYWNGSQPPPSPARDTSTWWPALRAISALDWSWFPSIPPLIPPPDYDLLLDLFTDNSHTADTFSLSPIPIVTRPLATPIPPIFQRSDNTYILPLFNLATPVTYQFPGLKPTYIRLHQSGYQTPARTVTGTDTISVPFTPGSFFLLELALG